MRFALMGLAVIAVACDRAPRSLAYQGYRIGMSADSALRLAEQDAGERPFCAPTTSDGGRLFCGAGDLAPGMRSRVYLVLVDGRLAGLDIALRADSLAVESVRHAIVETWGRPDSTTLPADKTPSGAISEAIGQWLRGDTYAVAGVHEMNGVRWLAVDLQPASQAINDARRESEGTQRLAP